MKLSTLQAKIMRQASSRLDAPFYINDAVRYKSLLSKCPFPLTTIGKETSKVFFGNIFTRRFVADDIHGVPYLRASDMQRSDLSTGKFIANQQANDLDYLKLHKHWILISCSGTLGNCVYTDEQFEGVLGTHDLIRCIPFKRNICDGILYAFLAGKYGYATLTHSQYGSVIQHINPDHVKEIEIPIFPDALQKKVQDLVQSSARLREEADVAYRQAIGIIEKEFTELAYKHRKTSSIISSKIFNSPNQRLDATYHIGDGELIARQIKQGYDWKPLGELSKRIFRPDIFKRNYVKDGIMFLSSSDILMADPTSDKFISRKTDNLENLTVKENWILIPRSGTIGNVILTNRQHAQKLVSEHVVRLEPNNILRVGYVFAFLASRLGTALIQREIFGSVIQHIEPPHISRIPIPIIDDERMGQIDELMASYRKKLGNGIAMQRQAIQLIEEEIEKWQES